jgi:hypothetical protein
MIQRRERLRLAREPGEAFGVERERLGENLDGDLAIEPGVGRAIDLAHAAGAERGLDLVGAEASAGRHGHRRTSLLRGKRATGAFS